MASRRAAMARFRAATIGEVNERLFEDAVLIAEMANWNAPRAAVHRTGPHREHTLAGSYSASFSAEGAQVRTPVFYWRFQEYGTQRHGAQPHVRPAIEAVRMFRGGGAYKVHGGGLR